MVVSADSSTENGGGTEHSHREATASIMEIDAKGDLVLLIQHDFTTYTAAHKYRVSSAAVQSKSKYFTRLLQGGFGESQKVEDTQLDLRKRYANIAEAPTTALPVVTVRDIGRISVVKSIHALYADFLYILHGNYTQTFPPVTNLANLAIVADRFDALDAVKTYVLRKKIIRTLEGKTSPKVDNALSEERVRQRLLIAILLDYPPWLEKYSARLIIKGWLGRELFETAALWTDLPYRVEEELTFRRDCILETIQSLQDHFVRLYMSRERQCKLGYDSSAQCDSFQLGEMVRFFTRIGTLRIKGAILDPMEPEASFDGDISELIDALKQAPEYQIDRNHSHCGVRTRILPLLDLLRESLCYVRVCAECWAQDRAQEMWIDAKRPLHWKRHEFSFRSTGHREIHARVRALFTANERDWGG